MKTHLVVNPINETNKKHPPEEFGESAVGLMDVGG
jgi:hypothetical protein